jgi:hypothetical protein
VQWRRLGWLKYNADTDIKQTQKSHRTMNRHLNHERQQWKTGHAKEKALMRSIKLVNANKDAEKLCTICGKLNGRNKMEIISKIKHWIIMWSSNLVSGYLSIKIKSKITKQYFPIHVHCSIIHNSQEVKETQIDR